MTRIKINKLKKSNFIVAILFVCTFFSACSQATPQLSPMPAINMSKNTIEAVDPTLEAPEETQELQMQSPIELSEPIQELINQGSNIENNGIAAISDDIIYFVQNGLNSITENGRHRNILIYEDNMICLNVYQDYIYYVSSEDYKVYKIDKEANEPPTNLNISGAYSMMIIQDHLYYQNAIGENADNYIYRTDMDGKNPENLMIKASVFCTDGQSIYYANQEDDNKVYSLDTCTGEIMQLSNNQASQLNILDGNLFYINKTTKHITKLDVTALDSIVISEEACSYLNNDNTNLIFYLEQKNQLGIMNTDGTQVDIILEYDDINALNVVGNWIFFETYENTFEEETFFLKIDTKELSNELPSTSTAKIVDYDPIQKLVYIDYVTYYIGELALEEYLNDNAVSERNAKEALDATNGVYIQNKKQKIVAYKLSDLSQIFLNINSDSSSTVENYSASVSGFEEIFSKDSSLIYDQIYSITGFEGQLIKLEQIYQP